MAEVQLRNIHEAVAATREALRDKRPEPSPGGVVVSVPTVGGGAKGD